MIYFDYVSMSYEAAVDFCKTYHWHAHRLDEGHSTSIKSVAHPESEGGNDTRKGGDFCVLIYNLDNNTRRYARAMDVTRA